MKKTKVFGAKEFAPDSLNIQIGCERGCHYCWAASKSVRRKQTKDFKQWLRPRKNLKKINTRYQKRQGRIMFPSTHDITSLNVDDYLKVLKQLLSSGNDVVLVTKPEFAIVERMVAELAPWKDENLVLRFTITSADNKTIRLWEPSTPLYEERLKSLKLAFRHGYNTSVLIEPCLDKDPLKIIKAVYPYVVDSIIYGKMNGGREHLKRNGFAKQAELMKACEALERIQKENWESIIERVEAYAEAKRSEMLEVPRPVIRTKDSGVVEYLSQEPTDLSRDQAPAGRISTPSIRPKDSGKTEYGKKRVTKPIRIPVIRTKDSGHTEY
jgi:DNA repair photolyase